MIVTYDCQNIFIVQASGTCIVKLFTVVINTVLMYSTDFVSARNLQETTVIV
jgi:hypothetical protein